MRILIPMTRALMASLMVLLASCGAGSWQLCLDAEGHLRLKAGDADCSASCASGESGVDAAGSEAFGGLDGEPCCTDFSLPFFSFQNRHPGSDLAWAFPTPATTPATLALTCPGRLPLSGFGSPPGANDSLTAHRTVVLRL
ncbi:MAG: hypothetical protein A3K19_31250 [Lentisphaerae bacterium RIFOXYB12_FULL_65_16]|nr:MAG: hypothetical protein A3K18_22610 [Lentisphaerae bacterium RIFOXYA12_64_32]OGV87162.1 MAG: hypothetical protein A3K19_31250 [Lentisphaerae bacterium RIFOXYB12_FULL_65_16]